MGQRVFIAGEMALLTLNIPKNMVFDIRVSTPLFSPEMFVIKVKLEIVKGHISVSMRQERDLE